MGRSKWVAGLRTMGLLPGPPKNLMHVPGSQWDTFQWDQYQSRRQCLRISLAQSPGGTSMPAPSIGEWAWNTWGRLQLVSLIYHLNTTLISPRCHICQKCFYLSSEYYLNITSGRIIGNGRHAHSTRFFTSSSRHRNWFIPRPGMAIVSPFKWLGRVEGMVAESE